MRATSRASPIFPFVLGALSAATSAFFWWLFFERYVRNMECLATVKSSCIAADDSNVVSGSIFWSFFAVLFALLSLWLLRIAALRFRARPRTRR